MHNPFFSTFDLQSRQIRWFMAHWWQFMLLKFKTTGIIAAALIGSATALAAILYLITQLTVQTRSPADLLPGTQTVAYIQQPSSALLQILQPWLPALPDISGSPAAIAIIQTDENMQETVVFYHEDSAPATGLQVQYPPFAVSAETNEGLQLIQSTTASLAQMPTFQRIQPLDSSLSWAAVSSSIIRNNNSPEAALLTRYLLASASWLTVTSDGTTVAFETQLPASTGSADADTMLLSTNPAFVLHSQNLAAAWSDFLDLKTPAESQITTALAHQLVADTMADSISWEFDVLPLVSGAATLEVRLTESGSPLFTVHGNTSNIEAISLLHPTASSNTYIATETYQLSDNLQHTEVQLERTGSGQATTQEINGWSVQTSDKTGQMLLTATKGTEFIISTDEQLLSTGFSVQSDVSTLFERPQSGHINSFGIIDMPQWNPLGSIIRLPFGMEQKRFLWLQTSRSDRHRLVLMPLSQ